MKAETIIIVKQVKESRYRLYRSPYRKNPLPDFFRFVLNGYPLFAEGADWIPADSFVGAILPAGTPCCWRPRATET